VFCILLNLGYFLAANFWRKIDPPPAAGNFWKISIEKITKIICYASNKIGMKEVTAHLEDHFFGIH
jgi:hypothetical protein